MGHALIDVTSGRDVLNVLLLVVNHFTCNVLHALIDLIYIRCDLCNCLFDLIKSMTVILEHGVK